jgi:hypothetical protein
MSKEEAAKLVSNGLASNDDVQPTLKSGQPRDQVDVVMRLERFTDVKAAIDQVHQQPVARVVRGRETATADDFNLLRFLQSSTDDPV